MATKKSVSKKRSVAKKTSVKARKAKKNEMQSFKLSRDNEPFLTFAITRQTLYWTVISVMVLVMGLWVINLQNKVNILYDTIDLNQAIYDTTIPVKTVR